MSNKAARGRSAWSARLAIGITLLLVISLLLLTGAATKPPYARALYPHWTGACQENTRVKVLVRDHRDHGEENPETSATVHRLIWRDGGCEIAFGHWVSPYTGEVIHDPTKLDIDHVVPLKAAHEAGGWRWTRERRRQYANFLGYRDHLVAVEAELNRAKGSRGPAEWVPPSPAAWCRYGQAWATVKFVWGLQVTEKERAAVKRLVETCPAP